MGAVVMILRLSHRPIAQADVVAVARHDAPVSLDLPDQPAEPADGGTSAAGWLLDQAAGIGEPLPRDAVRAMLLLQAHVCPAPRVAAGLVGLLNSKITPWVPETGAHSALSDHGPQAHAALTLIGEGSFLGKDATRADARSLLAEAGLTPLRLSTVEARSLLAGTQATLGLLVLCLADLAHLAAMADVTAALTVEALLGTSSAFDAAVHELRPHPGQLASAANLRLLLRDAEAVRHSTVLQDAYSLRCAPQVAGAFRDTLTFAGSTVEGQLLGAPAQGAGLGMAADFLCIATAEVGSICERRIDRLLDPARSRGLPDLPGCLAVHRTAADLAAETRRLAAAPSTVDAAILDALREDHATPAWAAARRLRRCTDNLAGVLASELLVATQALRTRDTHSPSPPARLAMGSLTLTGSASDRLARARDALRGNGLRQAIESVLGPLL